MALRDVSGDTGRPKDGRRLANRQADKQLLCELLNGISGAQGGRARSPVSDDTGDGQISAGLADAILHFQRTHKDLVADGVVSRTRNTIKRLNALSEPRRATGLLLTADDRVSDRWASIKPEVIALLRKSYQSASAENEHLKRGFKDGENNTNKPFDDVLATLEAEQTQVSLLNEIYLIVAATAPNLWGLIDGIGAGWRGDSSSGFLFNATSATQIEQVLRQSPSFCADLPPAESSHQESEFGKGQARKCYRQLGVVGNPGLHICIVRTNVKPFGGFHNIHFDPHQIAKDKTKLCSCWYAGLNHHFSDVGAYLVGKLAMPFIKGELQKRLPSIYNAINSLPNAPPYISPDIVWKTIENTLLDALLKGSEGFDALEAWASDPKKAPPAIRDLPVIGPTLAETLGPVMGGFKLWYMNFV